MKHTLKTTVLFLAVLFLAFSLNSCGKKETTDTKTEPKKEENKKEETKSDKTSSGNDIDAMIDDYEKLMKEYVEVTKKFTAGDMSVSDKYTDLGKRSQEFSTKLSQSAPKMTVEQSKRMGDISKWAAEEMQKK